MKINKTISQKGKFKEEIQTALYKSENIKELILNNFNETDIKKVRDEFRKHVQSHLFIDDSIETTDSFIFYDIALPHIGTSIKDCTVIMYAICHRDILDNYIKDGYFGNRADVLAEMIEEALICDKNKSNNFGIGELALDSVGIYNSTKFCGNIMTFKVVTFR